MSVWLYIYIENLCQDLNYGLSRKVRRGENIAGEEVANLSHGLPCLVQNTMPYHFLAQICRKGRKK